MDSQDKPKEVPEGEVIIQSKEIPPEIKDQIEMQMISQAISQAPISGIAYFPTHLDCVRAFCIGAKGRGVCYIGTLATKTPAEVIEGRIKLIEEEVNNELIPSLRELIKAGNYSLEQMTDVLDHITDSIYVLLGAAVNFGLPYDTAFGIVHSYNMRKVIRPGGPKFNEAGKVMKPEDWISPEKDMFNLVLEAFKEATKIQNERKAKVPQRADNPEGKNSLMQEGGNGEDGQKMH